MTFSKANQKSKLKTYLVVVTQYDDLYPFQINLTVFLTDKFKYQMFGKCGLQIFFFIVTDRAKDWERLSENYKRD